MNDFEKKFIDIYKGFYAYVNRRALFFLKDPAGSQDITQEVFFKVLKLMKRDKNFEITFPFVIKVTTNLCLDKLKSKKRVRENEDYNLENIQNGKQDIYKSVLLKEIIAQLPEKLKDIAVYYYLDGFTTQEIAGLTESSLSTIERRISQIKKNLRGFS